MVNPSDPIRPSARSAVAAPVPAPTGTTTTGTTGTTRTAETRTAETRTAPAVTAPGTSAPGPVNGAVRNGSAVLESVSPAKPDAVVAIEVGADAITAALVDGSGQILRVTQRAIPEGAAAVVEAICDVAVLAGSWRAGRVMAAGIVVPGIVDVDAGVVRHSARLGWHNVELGALVSADLGVPVRVDQSVRAGALAESAGGVGRGRADWLYLRLGADIDAAAFVGGRIQRGVTGSAGEVGHLVIYPFGELCRCGQRGCLQAYASATSIRRRYAEISRAPRTVTEIAGLVGREPLADEVWSQACAAIGAALHAYTMLNDPEMIVLGGELASTGEILLATVAEELRQRLTWREPPRLALARIGEGAGRAGAALLGWEVAG